MRIIIAAAAVMGMWASAAAYAEAPRLHAIQSVNINASADAVWKATKDFDSLNTWHPAVATDVIVEGTNDKVGAVRLLTLKGGGTIKEKLLSFDPAARKFKYAILEGVLPVSDYTSTFSVMSTGKGKSKVTWSGSFRRKNTGDNPADNENDKTAVDTITGVYKGGLDNLKKMLDSQ